MDIEKSTFSENKFIIIIGFPQGGAHKYVHMLIDVNDLPFRSINLNHAHNNSDALWSTWTMPFNVNVRVIVWAFVI